MEPTMKKLTLLPLVFLLTACPNWTGAHKGEAESQAATYAKEMDYDVKATSCVRQDTDGDGYVSCTIRLADDTTLNVECAGAYNLNSGCREPKINMNQMKSR